MSADVRVPSRVVRLIESEVIPLRYLRKETGLRRIFAIHLAVSQEDRIEVPHLTGVHHTINVLAIGRTQYHLTHLVFDADTIIDDHRIQEVRGFDSLQV